jgi:two-component system nitrogen regulation sensor histidine kinase NtrY
MLQKRYDFHRLPTFTTRVEMTDSAVFPKPAGAAQTLPPVKRADTYARIVGYAAVILALASVTGTYAMLIGITPFQPTGDVMVIAVTLNIVLVLVLIGVISWEGFRIWSSRRKGRAAARLHVRIVALFSVISAVPALVVAGAATVTLDRGLDQWFGDRTRKIVEDARTVAESYVQEHGRVLRGDLLALATEIDRSRSMYDFNPSQFDLMLQTQLAQRQLPAAFLMQGDGTIVTSTVLNPDFKVVMPPGAAFSEAASGELVFLKPGPTSQVGGVMRLRAYDDMYLYVTRQMDPKVTSHLRLVDERTTEYRNLVENRASIQVAFALVYVGAALVLMLCAIWIGINFANNLVSPIRRLIHASEEVSHGNLETQVPLIQREGDLRNLSVTFNNMIRQIGGQRDELLQASEMIDKRRRFTEAVLAGVTAGVLGIDADGRINLANRSILSLLGASQNELLGNEINEVIPDLEPIYEKARKGDTRPQHEQVTLHRFGRERVLNVRVTTETSATREHGYVMTLDDITDLVSAQRMSAWADVARRIAHEIKNPLTPIQLSAERIRRKYGKQIVADREIFDQCVDTIVRQVGDIGRMVDEFSSFARMPKPVMEMRNLSEAVREAVFLTSVASPDTEFSTSFPDDLPRGMFDHRLIAQAVTNVVKNATESVKSAIAKRKDDGHIDISVMEEGGDFVIQVTDNGVGLPREKRQRLLEPYITTREKGTGLGLAIVGKILEEHGGRIELLDPPKDWHDGQGARILLIFPIIATADDQPAGANNGQVDEAMSI